MQEEARVRAWSADEVRGRRVVLGTFCLEVFYTLYNNFTHDIFMYV